MMNEARHPLVNRARSLAQTMHDGQTYNGETFFYGHLVAVHALATRMDSSPQVQQAAYLHDIVEDTTMDYDALQALGFSEDVVGAVSHLTRQNDERYEDYIERIVHAQRRAGEIARIVKFADLVVNLATSYEDPQFPSPGVPRYKRALTELLEVL